MNVDGPGFSHHYATQPLELIVKTQAAKDMQMQVVENIRNRTQQSVRAPHKALGNSYDGHAGTYGADGKKMHIPHVEATDTARKVKKSVDIMA